MRLIDADELKKMFMYAEDAEYSKWSLNGVISEIDDMPTVDVLEQIRAEIERLHYHPKLDFIKNDEVVEMVIDIIDKHKGDKE